MQISTVGVSAIISPAGVVRERTELFTPAQMVATVPLRTSLTPATRYGDWVTWGFRALAVAVAVAGMAGARQVPRGARVAAEPAPPWRLPKGKPAARTRKPAAKRPAGGRPRTTSGSRPGSAPRAGR